MRSALAFELPPALEAHEPPEARGIGRDEVRLMVASRSDGAIEHARFYDLPELLDPGDLLVVNTSATLPAAVPAKRADGTPVQLHFATEAPDPPGRGWWVVELRRGDGAPVGVEPAQTATTSTPAASLASASSLPELRPGERLTLAGGVVAELAAPYAGGTRLWLARVETRETVPDYLWRHGRPIRYRYVPAEWPLGDYQTAYALDLGSAEMPSAGRPFTSDLITRLVASGILVAPVTLHTGVSSPDRDEGPYPERYRVPVQTARLIEAVHGWGGRTIAVGTTVVRALETAAGPGGAIAAGEGWTELVVTAERGLQAVDGLLTGWHEPRASHLLMLEAAAGPELLERSYRAALEHGYLWHEFGDSHLILP